MDSLKAEIERKRKESTGLVGPNKKYFKRGDLIAKETNEYWKKRHGANQEALVESRSGASAPDPNDITEKNVLPRKEVIRRLRTRNEPVRIFGENDIDAYKRLRYLEITEPEVEKGMRNDFREAMEKLDQKFLEEMVKSSGDEKKSNLDVEVRDDGTTMENLLPAIYCQFPGDILLLEPGLDVGNRPNDCEIVLKFLKFIIRKWGLELNSREPAEKCTTKGKIASAQYTQTVAYLRPLFRKLKSKSLQEDILESLLEIVKYMFKNNYIKANEAYLEMAIGNAPWPIGATMVGIHARPGREKISTKHVAHVLNDETQRKYIQGLKRLMTKCQQYYPTDPSKFVEFGAARAAPSRFVAAQHPSPTGTDEEDNE